MKPVELRPDKLKVIVKGLYSKHDPMTWPLTAEEGDNAEATLVSNKKLVTVAK